MQLELPLCVPYLRWPSSRPVGRSISCIPVSWPARRKESHGVSAIADTMEVVGVVHDQLYRLVPNIIGHIVSSEMLSDGVILRHANCSSNKMTGPKVRSSQARKAIGS